MTDYIKREDAKKWLTNLKEDCGRYQDLWHYAEALEQIVELLDADVAPVRHGRWIVDGEPPMLVIKCSECGQKYFNHAMQNFANFCSNCGAKMDEEETDEQNTTQR